MPAPGTAAPEPPITPAPTAAAVRDPILRIALPVPRRRLFDYLPPPAKQPLQPGMRLLVPFGRGRRIGVLLAGAATSELPRERLRCALASLDAAPLLNAAQLRLLQWGSSYYQHPIGEVVFGALPVLLRDSAAPPPEEGCWRAADPEPGTTPTRISTHMHALLEELRRRPEGLDAAELNSGQRRSLAALARRGLACRAPAAGGRPPPPPRPGPRLNPAQQAAVTTILAELERPRRFLLEGVTGSGKTEVYLRIVEEVVRRGRQALVLLPEISLTPQQVRRFRERLQVPVAVLHSRLAERARLRNWQAARDGAAPVLLGTRSAVWAPLRNPGVIIVDEEHDPSYKQQQGFRYCARDVAVMRGRHQRVPVILGSATPSLESLYNGARRRYRVLPLPHRTGDAELPEMRLLDLRGARMRGAFAEPLLGTIGEHLERGRQVLIFLNRRGFAPLLLCHACGWRAVCPACELPATYHKRERRLRCHRCGWQQPWQGRCAGPECRGDCLELGHGTERLEQTLADVFPAARLVRIDRDTTRRRGRLEQLLAEARSGRADLLIGTQMLAKGHHFPDLTLVVVVNADHGLYSLDFRALEHMAQLIIQVGGRAGRTREPGLVLLQTHQPQHPLLRKLLADGYGAFAAAALEERRAAGLPPYRRWALLGTEAKRRQDSLDFLHRAGSLPELTRLEKLEHFGPHAAPIPRRQGRYRDQLLLQACSPRLVPGALGAWSQRLEELPRPSDLRWSLDVDPVEIL